MASESPPGLISIVVPVFNEAENITALIARIARDVHDAHETLIVYDFEEDTTVPVARALADRDASIRLVRNDLGRGVLHALKKGLMSSDGDAVCVVMADLSDDLTQIDQLASLIRAGAAVAAPSRYMRGGMQVGGPLVKRGISRLAGVSLHLLTGLGTHDPTNNYKAYSRRFLEGVEVESTAGFEVALELTVKAHLAGERIVEVPTTWRDRTHGTSRFRLFQWAPAYLRWYLRCVIGTWSTRRR